MATTNADNEALDQIWALRLVAFFDPEELKRRRASSHPGYAFDQVKEHLQSLLRQDLDDAAQ